MSNHRSLFFVLFALFGLFSACSKESPGPQVECDPPMKMIDGVCVAAPVTVEVPDVKNVMAQVDSLDGVSGDDLKARHEAELAAIVAGQTKEVEPSGPCVSICERSVECVPRFPNAPGSVKDDIEVCVANCESYSLSEDDFACWESAPCGAFVGRSVALKTRACQLQKSDDARGDNSTDLVKSTRNQLFKAAKLCEDMKRDVAKKSGEDGGFVWATLKRTASGDTAWERDIIEGKMGQFRIAVQAMNSLDVPLLTSECKLALAQAAADSVAACKSYTRKDPNWLKSVGKSECKPNAPSPWPEP